MEKEQCWFNKYSGIRCPETARWHLPTLDNGFLRACKWCDEHKNDNDVLIESEEEKESK